jgi:hypothetical protein
MTEGEDRIDATTTLTKYERDSSLSRKLRRSVAAPRDDIGRREYTQCYRQLLITALVMS